MPELAGDVALGSNRYSVKRNVNGVLEYQETELSNQESVPDILPVSSVWNRGTPGGMGETFRTSEDSMGYMYGDNTDATSYGVIRLRGKAVTSAATTNAVPSSPVFMFEETDGTTQFIYILCGRYGYKCKSSGSAITIETEKDFGASAICGKPAKYKGIWYIPLGASVDATKLTTVAATGGGADSYTAIAGSIRAIAFATTKQGAVTALARAHSSNLVDIATDSPAATFGGDFEVGDSGSVITSMADSASGLIVAKSNNLWRLVNGVAQQLTRFNEGDKHADYGAGLLVPGESNAAFYNHRGLTLFSDESPDDISPDNSPTYTFYGTGATPPQGFDFKECAYASDTWMYFLADHVVGGTAGTDILALRRNGKDRTWFTFAKFDASMRGALVDSSQQLWTVSITNSKFIHVKLGKGGQPQSAATTKGESGLSGAHQFPATDFGFPHTLKQVRSFEGMFRGLDANNSIRFNKSIDGANVSTHGSAYTSSGLAQEEFTSSTTGYKVAGRLAFNADGSGDPRCESFVIRATLRPDTLRRIDFTLTTNTPYADGSPSILDGPTVLSNWRAVSRGAPQTFADPGGNSLSIVVWNVAPQVTFVDEGQIHYEIGVSAYVWVTS